jgi:hypothetical protein
VSALSDFGCYSDGWEQPISVELVNSRTTRLIERYSGSLSFCGFAVAVLSTNTLNGSAQMTKDTPSCCTNRPGKNYAFVIRLMARVVAFYGCTSGSALRTSVVNTALSYASVNFPAGGGQKCLCLLLEYGRFTRCTE